MDSPSPAAMASPSLRSVVYTLLTMNTIQNRCLQVIKAFQGGSEGFFSLLWTSRIYDSGTVTSLLQYTGVSLHINNQLREATGNEDIRFQVLIPDFLSRVGLSCPSLFEQVKPCFSQLVDISDGNLQSPAFRSRVFVWATTGSPFAAPSSETIRVCISLPLSSTR